MSNAGSTNLCKKNRNLITEGMRRLLGKNRENKSTRDCTSLIFPTPGRVEQSTNVRVISQKIYAENNGVIRNYTRLINMRDGDEEEKKRTGEIISLDSRKGLG